MNKPLLREVFLEGQSKTIKVYFSKDMDTYLTDLLAPMKEVWEKRDKQGYEYFVKVKVQELAERLNW